MSSEQYYINSDIILKSRISNQNQYVFYEKFYSNVIKKNTNKTNETEIDEQYFTPSTDKYFNTELERRCYCLCKINVFYLIFAMLVFLTILLGLLNYGTYRLMIDQFKFDKQGS